MRFSAVACLVLMTILAAPVLAQEVTEIRHTHYVLNVRSGPGLGNSVIGSVDNCDRLEVISLENRWYEIKFGDGTAYVAGWYTAAGEPHCAAASPSGASGAATTTTTTTTSATSTTTAPAGGEQTLDNFSGNACYGDMDCGDGSTPQSMFLWKTGWCAATISAGVANWTLQQCQAGLGLIPGAMPAMTGSAPTGGSSGSSSSSDDSGSGSGGGQQPGNTGSGSGGNCNHDTHVWAPHVGRCVPHS